MDLENIAETKKFLRNFEIEMGKLSLAGKINGPVHFAIGNEEQTIKIFRGLVSKDYCLSSLVSLPEEIKLLQDNSLIETHESVNGDHQIFRGIKKSDWVFGSYRNHLQALLHGVPEKVVKENIINGGSMEAIYPEYRIFTSGIVGGQLPIAVGYAISLKKKNSKSHVWVFCGDMAAETGIFEETTKYAQNFNLPITFVIEHNGLSVDTPTEKVWNGISPLRRSNTIRYFYKNQVPHQGVGREVGF